MAILRCKMCGGQLEVSGQESVVTCDYCGSRQTLPTLDHEKKQNLFNRANRLRMANEFDKASGVFESIVAEFPEEAEAYWGLVLCKYGIEYVDDPVTGKKIPTCHRSSFECVLEDANFEMTLEYADSVARSVYREEAKAFERIRAGIIEVSSKEEPYDIFICYKETDENGNRTLDSVLAQDVYDALTDKGYKVFFSRITLEDKLGVEYEPYIFAALNSSKIMLVFGTNYEYFTAVWVKNEWSRFLSLIAKGEKKTLIPCYKDIDAYDIPNEFRKLQGQDLGKLGAVQDLVRGIEKILPRETVKETVVQQSLANPTVQSLLKRAFIFLEDEEWNSANEYCEKVLDIDPENGEAYLGKLMIELKVKKQEALKDLSESFENNNNFVKACRFGNNQLKNILSGYVLYIKERNEITQKEEIYLQAKSYMNKRIESYLYKANELFVSIADYKDSKILADQCLETSNKIKYDRALGLMELNHENSYFSAAKIFKSISEYKDSKELERKCVEEIEKIKTTRTKVNHLMNELNRIAEEEAKMIFRRRAIQKQRNEFIEKRPYLECLSMKFNGIICEIQTLEQVNKDLYTKINELKSKKDSLGIFSGKQKRQIEQDISIIQDNIKNNQNKIDLLEKQCDGYHSQEEIEVKLSELSCLINDFNNECNTESFNQSSVQDIIRELEQTEEGRKSIDSFRKKQKIVEQRIHTLDNLKLECKVGNTIFLGMDNNEAIEWTVLDVEGNKALLLTKNAIDCKRYNDKYEDVTWGTCTLRKWLNHIFIKQTFNEEENNLILETLVKPYKNPMYDTKQGNGTTDNIFLLSITEVNKYFKDLKLRQCKSNENAISNGAYTRPNGNCCWFLRSAGYDSKYVTYVDENGYVCENGCRVSNSNYGVRPAMWIDLSK